MEYIIEYALVYIQEFFKNEYSGHDYYHSLRVYRVARYLAETEGADALIVSLAAVLHDVDDIKISPDSYKDKSNAVTFLQKHNIPNSIIACICNIINEVSFNGDDTVSPSTIEGKCVQDADRLDALGAIGIARAFAYGGNHKREIYNPDIVPVLHMTKDEYRNHVSTSVNHFYEKLFLIKDMMNTKTAYEIASKRENYMKAFLDEFLMEWDGNDCDIIK